MRKNKPRKIYKYKVATFGPLQIAEEYGYFDEDVMTPIRMQMLGWEVCGDAMSFRSQYETLTSIPFRMETKHIRTI